MFFVSSFVLTSKEVPLATTGNISQLGIQGARGGAPRLRSRLRSGPAAITEPRRILPHKMLLDRRILINFFLAII